MPEALRLNEALAQFRETADMPAQLMTPYSEVCRAWEALELSVRTALTDPGFRAFGGKHVASLQGSLDRLHQRRATFVGACLEHAATQKNGHA